MNMFESTTHFDFDDDIILNASFTPTVKSAQASQIQKRVSTELDKEVCKKPKFIEGVSSVGSEPVKKTCRIGQETVCRDTFTSPNRVVKRKFPGPAGLLPEIGASNKSILQLLETEKFKNDDTEAIPILSQQTISVFENGPWKEMKRDLEEHSGENLLERFNIKWVKNQAFKHLLNHKAPFLAAVIQNLDIFDGKIPTVNVTLKDSTGDIRGTILHSLYEKYSGYFKIGSVLVLKHFGVLSTSYNNHCLTITPNNLVSIYCPETPKKLPNDAAKEGFINSNVDTVKKIIIQDCNTEEILKKHNEDVVAYTEQKSKKINFGNLYRSSSSEAGPSCDTRNVFVSTELPLVKSKCRSSSESILAFPSTSSRNDTPSTSKKVPDTSGISYPATNQGSSAKIKFNNTETVLNNMVFSDQEVCCRNDTPSTSKTVPETTRIFSVTNQGSSVKKKFNFKQFYRNNTNTVFTDNKRSNQDVCYGIGLPSTSKIVPGTSGISFSVINQANTEMAVNKLNFSDNTRNNQEECDNLVITTNQISVKPDHKEHAEIWKNLLEDMDTDSLFDDF